MSGGFFRGTSADQDTRFSNKQAKLLKSQKFAPELDHLVDMAKVKMDVIRPWIATRATELLGFEDEVLINFVYGLLDGKVVDGKQIQIQLTGFMEKNTGKFMKELWSLLLSAQNNVSGVPQQFLDAKEEETRKKKAETDRIAQEIQKRKEKEGMQLEKQSRVDGEADISRSIKGDSDLVSKHSVAKASSVQPKEERKVDGRHGSRARSGSTSSATRSRTNSISKSKSYSEEHKSRSVSVSSQSQRRAVSPVRRYQSPVRQSLSPERRYRSPPRRSISPRRRHSPRNSRSPSRRRSPHIRRRSASHSRQRSPSPFRQRSPRARRRSPPFLRHRSPSPLRRRSPSPSRRRSPIKVRRRSPSSLRRRSPIRRRSPSPLRRRSPPPRSPKHRKRSPVRSLKSHPADSQKYPQQRNRSHSPYRTRSPSHQNRRSMSRERDNHIDDIESRRYRDEPTSQRGHEKRSSVQHALERELIERRDLGHKVSENVSHKVQISLRSPQRDVRNQSDNVRRMVPVVPPEKSPSQSESPTHAYKLKPKINRRSRSLSKSPVRQIRVPVPRYDSPVISREEQSSHAREASRHRTDSLCKRSKDSSTDVGLKRSYANDISPELYSPDILAADQSPTAQGRPVDQSPTAQGRPVSLELRKKDSGLSDMDLPERHVWQLSRSSEEREYGPGSVKEDRGFLGNEHDRQMSAKQLSRDASSLEKKECNEQPIMSSRGDDYEVKDEKRPLPKSDGYKELHHEAEFITRSKKKVDNKDQLNMNNSDSEETDTYRYQNMEKRKHKKSDKRKRDSDENSESDSQIDDRKEAKSRRKDEKRLRKEARRRRREERHRRRLERHAGKLKLKSMDTVMPPSDFEKNHNDANGSDADAAIRKNSHPSDADETESEQKKLEIELRKKALESLRAKKAISH